MAGNFSSRPALNTQTGSRPGTRPSGSRGSAGHAQIPLSPKQRAGARGVSVPPPPGLSAVVLPPTPPACLPPHLHGVVCVLVIKDEGLLDELVLLLQNVDVGLVIHDALLVVLEVVQLVFQGAVHLNGDAPNLLVAGGDRQEV